MKSPIAISILVLAAVPVGTVAAGEGDATQLFAAGSLRGVLTDVAEQFATSTGNPVEATFAPSGLLRERIEQGEGAEVFASANMAHPARLAEAGGWSAPVVFTRNNLCALAQPGMAVESDTLLEVMLDPDVKLGTSTPKADPSGDYAWALFEKAEQVRAGSFAQLEAKALTLTGGPDSAPAPEGRNLYAWVMDEERADVFLTYCTNAVAAREEIADLQIVEVPAQLEVGATYGLSVRDDAPAAARELAEYILSPEAQEVFRRYGFGAI